MELEENQLKWLQWTSPLMSENLSRYGDVMIMDSTFKSNSLDLPLIVAVVKDGNGHVKLAGLAVVCRERSAAFSWFLENLMSWGWTPKLVFTDGDDGMANAISKIN